jgi:hypothetical protein
LPFGRIYDKKSRRFEGLLVVRGLLGSRASRPSVTTRSRHDEEKRLMHKAARTWSIFIRRWTGGTSFMFARAALLGSAFLLGMIAA